MLEARNQKSRVKIGLESRALIRVKVDLREWAEYALKGSPALETKLLQLAPVVEVKHDAIVRDVVRVGIQASTANVRNASVRDELDRHLNGTGRDFVVVAVF